MTYKPITESVRGIYADRVEHILGLSREQIRAEFDAWLNEVKAEAWEEGAESAFYNPEIRDLVDYPDENPYRKAEK